MLDRGGRGSGRVRGRGPTRAGKLRGVSIVGLLLLLLVQPGVGGRGGGEGVVVVGRGRLVGIVLGLVQGLKEARPRRDRQRLDVWIRKRSMR